MDDTKRLSGFCEIGVQRGLIGGAEFLVQTAHLLLDVIVIDFER